MTTPLRAFLQVALGLAILATPAGAHDIPEQMRMHAWAKPEGDRLHVLVRVPLTLLLNLNLPKRGIGYLELSQLDEGLRTAIAAIAKDLEFFEDGRRLTLATGEGRISLPSDRSFESYEKALANLHGPRLSNDTDVFWNQGSFDAHLQYPIRSAQAGFSLDFHVSPGLGDRLKLDVRFLSSSGAVRAYELRTGTGEVAIDPRWHQAAWIFVKAGFFHILGGADHLLFLFCLVIPFRRVRPLVAIITSFTVAHSITLIASAWGIAPGGKWFPPLVETLIAASIFYMALENVIAADLRRRWLVTGLFGLVHGFGFSFVLKQDLQFVGSHLLVSLLSFNLGVELGQLLVLLIVLPVLALFFRLSFAPRYGVLILSVLIADTAWRWLLDRASALRQVDWPIPRTATLLASLRWSALAALLAGAMWLAIRSLRGRSHHINGFGRQIPASQQRSGR